MSTEITAETITDAQIIALREEAAQAGDAAMADVYDAALGEDRAAERLRKQGTSRAPGPWFRGHHLDGAGPSRFGWARQRAAGGVQYLGRTLREIARAECARVISDAQ